VEPGEVKTECLLFLLRRNSVEGQREAGFFTVSGAPLDDPLLDRLVEHGDSGTKCISRAGRRGKCRPKLFLGGLELGSDDAVSDLFACAVAHATGG